MAAPELCRTGEYGFRWDLYAGFDVTGLTLTVTITRPGSGDVIINDGDITVASAADGHIWVRPVSGTFDEPGFYDVEVKGVGASTTLKTPLAKIEVGEAL
jgi:hypothetical protein